GRATGVPQLEVFEDNVYAVWTVSKGTNKQLKSVKFNVEKL
ncbi:MAG: sialidase, partial [Lutibacter sp.]|nr:sialidase [Lutibacter sp.]